MKCCYCDKKLDTSVNTIPASWYGKYKGGELLAVICPECLANEKNNKMWSEHS